MSQLLYRVSRHFLADTNLMLLRYVEYLRITHGKFFKNAGCQSRATYTT